MTRSKISRRRFIEGCVGLTVANLIPGTTPFALAASMEERTVAAAKAAGAADVSGMIWSPYLVPMQPVIAEFKKQTGIGVGGVQDISIFDAPQRAMAEALSSVTIGSQDVATRTGTIVVERGREPLYLVVGSFLPTIWRFSGAVERVERLLIPLELVGRERAAPRHRGR